MMKFPDDATVGHLAARSWVLQRYPQMEIADKVSVRLMYDMMAAYAKQPKAAEPKPTCCEYHKDGGMAGVPCPRVETHQCQACASIDRYHPAQKVLDGTWVHLSKDGESPAFTCREPHSEHRPECNHWTGPIGAIGCICGTGTTEATCCGDAHAELNAATDHLKAIGFEQDAVAVPTVHGSLRAVLAWRNTRAEIAEAALKALQVCSICGQPTRMACADCRIIFKTAIYVCEKKACRIEHEKKCPDAVRNAIQVVLKGGR
jgi:hypothetical protein